MSDRADHSGPAAITFKYLVDRAKYTQDHVRGGAVYDEIRITFGDLVPIINDSQGDVEYINQTIMWPLGQVKYAIYMDYYKQLKIGNIKHIIPQITYLVVNAPSMPNAGLAPPPAHYEEIETPLSEQQIIWSAIYKYDWDKATVDSITNYIRNGIPRLQKGTRLPDYPDAAGRPELSPDTRQGRW